MKSIMLIDEFKLVNYAGGIEQVVCGLANDFVKRGYEVTLVSLDREKGLPFFPLDENVSFINLCYDVGGLYFTPSYFLSKLKKEILRFFYGPNLISRGKKLQDPKKAYYYNEFKRRLSLIFDKNMPDIILTSGAITTAIVMDILKNKRKNNFQSLMLDSTTTIIITMCHINVSDAIRNSTPTEIQAWKESACVTVLMQSYVEQMKRIGVSEVYWMPNAVNQIFFDRQVDLSICHYRIVCVGRIEEHQKRPHLLIQSFAQVADHCPDWSLHFYGEQSNTHYLIRLKRLVEKYHLIGRVVFEGPSNAIVDHLQNADIFAFPSSSEGFGIALAEAMTVGLPAIGYRSCSAVNELIINEQTGFLCDDSVDDFAKKLEILMENQALRIQMGRNAAQAMKKYSPQYIWDKWEDLLLSLSSRIERD